MFHHHHHHHGEGYIVIRSRMHGKVLDVEGGQCCDFTRVILYHQKFPAEANQLWRLEPTGTGYFYIVSALNPAMVLHVDHHHHHSHEGAKIVIHNRKFPPHAEQMFLIEGDVFVSALNPELVLDIEGASHHDGAHLIVWHHKHGHHEHMNQSWEMTPP